MGARRERAPEEEASSRTCEGLLCLSLSWDVLWLDEEARGRRRVEVGDELPRENVVRCNKRWPCRDLGSEQRISDRSKI